jgi:soluble lytic murein transglycosylase-like protein
LKLKTRNSKLEQSHILNLKSQISNLKFVAIALCCLFISDTVAMADELRLRDGTVITVDESWERNDEVWYRQGQVIRSIPAAEILRGKAIANAVAVAPTNPKLSKKSSRRALRQAEDMTSNAPVLSAPAPNPNTSPVTRIVFKDGLQLDADAVWEMGERIGYRLGTIQAFIDKTEVAQVLKDYAPATAQPVKSVISTPFHFTTKHAGLDQLIAVNATRHGVDPLLIYLVMQQESGFNYRAVSHAGARGLMQLMPGTARQLGVRNIHDPVENVEAGTRYLKNLLQRFSGDVNLALAGYNAGEQAVVRYGYRVPPYRETINYVRRIGGAYQQFKK